MCTVTIVPHDHGIRLGCNRDESPARPSALPPIVLACGARQAVMPIDPQSGGTWIGVNDAGLIATLLNVYERPRSAVMPTPKRSRGTIIPQLLSYATLDDAFAWAASLEVADFAPFRLVLANRSRSAAFYHTEQSWLHSGPEAIRGPMLFTSSGLGDALVEPPRRALFEEYFAAGKDWGQQQDAYHRHSWPDRRHLSVCMQRDNARTVSYTFVELRGESARLCYLPGPPDQGGEFVCMGLDGNYGA